MAAQSQCAELSRSRARLAHSRLAIGHFTDLPAVCVRRAASATDLGTLWSCAARDAIFLPVLHGSAGAESRLPAGGGQRYAVTRGAASLCAAHARCLNGQAQQACGGCGDTRLQRGRASHRAAVTTAAGTRRINGLGVARPRPGPDGVVGSQHYAHLTTFDGPLKCRFVAAPLGAFFFRFQLLPGKAGMSSMSMVRMVVREADN
jgi:hypothetical protein